MGLSPNRQNCRFCGDWAGIARNVCDSCHTAQVNIHLVENGRAGEPTDQEVQDAYAQALHTCPLYQAPAKTAPWRQRSKPDAQSKPPSMAEQRASNTAISQTLMLCRTLLQHDRNSMAVAVGCSPAQVWRLESPGERVPAIWFLTYAQRLGLHEDGLWTLAEGLTEDPELAGDARFLLRFFVEHILR